MNPNSPQLARALTAAAIALLLVSLLGLITVDDDGGDTVAAGARTTTTADETTTTTAGEDSPAVGATTTTAAGTATTRASSATTAPGTASVPDPGPTKPPAPGIYVYAYTNSAEPSSNGDTETKFETLPPQDGVPRRRETYKDADGTTLVHEETWASDAIRIIKSNITAQGTNVECNWQPPVLVAQLPLAIGKTWSTNSTCTTSAQGVQLTIKQTTTSKVTGKIVDKVGDASIATWIIESSGKASINTPFGPSETSVTLVRHFAASKGLVTFEKGNGKTPAATYEYERTLKSLAPR